MDDRQIVKGLIEELENYVFNYDNEEEIENAISEAETDWNYRGIPEDLIEKAIEEFKTEYEIDE